MRLRDLPASTSPIPEPVGFVVKNGTNRLPVSGRPGPSSSTEISSWPEARCPNGSGRAARFLGRVDRVLDQVDQELLELVGVGVDREIGAAFDLDRHARLERGDAAGSALPIESGYGLRGRQAREPGVGRS